MPYYGAPSKGCEACRSRKVKCDGGRPTCDRCTKSGRQCPGYRELGSVIFRDENGRIMRRVTTKRGAADENTAAVGTEGVVVSQGEEAKARSHGGGAIKVRGWRESRVAEQQQDKEKSRWSKDVVAAAACRPTAAVPVRIGENEGISFFRQELAWEAVGMHFGSWGPISPALRSITSAFGLALLSFARRSPELRREAYNEYGAALQHAGQSLSHPEKAKSDTTLAVVVLLSFFETLAGQNMKTWASHTSGAASIFELRGFQQLSNPIIYALFFEARGMSMATSVIHKNPVPQVYFDYTHLAIQHEPPVIAHGSAAFLIAAEIANLSSAVNAGTYTSPEEILPLVDELEAKLSRWRATGPAEFDYETVHLTDEDATIETHRGRVRPYGPSYTTYQSTHAIQGWSLYRIGRIQLGELILGALRPAVSAGAPGTAMLRTTCHAVRRVMHQMAADICGSVPYSLGLGPSSSPPGPRPDGGGGDGGLGLAGGYMTLMPLWVAGCVEGRDHPLRKNAEMLFDLVAKRIGITHASLQLGMLEGLEGMAEWLDRLPDAGGGSNRGRRTDGGEVGDAGRDVCGRVNGPDKEFSITV